MAKKQPDGGNRPAKPGDVTCLDCWHAGEGKDAEGNPWPQHCGSCPCCR